MDSVEGRIMTFRRNLLHPGKGTILFLVFFFFLLIMTIPVFAQSLNIVSLNFEQFLGIKNDIKLEGYLPSYIFYLPNVRGVNWGESHLALKIWFSEALSPETNISLLVNDRIVFFHLLKNIQLQPGHLAYLDIPIPESAINEKNPLVKVEIQPTLSMGNNICEDLASGNLWMIIKKESFITYSLKSDWNPQTVPEFLNSMLNQVTIVLPQKPWSNQFISSYLTLYAFLHRAFRQFPLKIQTIMSAAVSAAPTVDDDTYQIYLLENSVRDFQIYGKKLYLTPEGVGLLVSEYQKLMMTKSGKSPSLIPTRTVQSTKKTFEEMGVPFLEMKGFGELKKTLSFSSSEIGGNSAQMTLQLFMNHSPLSAEFQGEALLKVYFNSQLIYSKRLDQKTGGQLTSLRIELPTQYTKRENEIQIAFLYYPDLKNCRQGIMPFEGFISGDSFIEVNRQRRPLAFSNWQDVPGFFGGRGKIVLPSQPDLNTLQIAASLYSSIRAMDNTPLEVEIIPLDKINEHFPQTSEISNLIPVWEEFNKISGTIHDILALPDFQNLDLFQKILTIISITADYYGKFTYQLMATPLSTSFQTQTVGVPTEFVLIISPGYIPSSLSSPVLATSDQLTLNNAIEGKDSFNLTLDEPVSLLSIFHQNNKPVILFTTYGHISLALDYFQKYFDINETLKTLNGNVAIFGKNGCVDLMIGSSSSGTQAIILPSFEQYFTDQGPLFLIIVLCIVIIIILIFYMRKHHGKKETK